MNYINVPLDDVIGSLTKLQDHDLSNFIVDLLVSRGSNKLTNIVVCRLRDKLQRNRRLLEAME